MLAKFYWIPIAVFFALVLSWSVYRDLHLERQYAGDLRNRVVGARMQKDGMSPYFYKWKQGDGFRYYDPNNFDSLRVSNITASPFYHYLMYPLTELPQRSISVVWLVLQYAVLLFIVLLALGAAHTPQQRWLGILTASLLLITEAWKMHAGNGQNYTIIVLLCMIFYCCISKKTVLMALLAGIAATTLILIKPTTVLFFVPFLFWVKTISRTRLFCSLLPVIISVAWILTSSRERHLWTDYRENIAQQILLHQDEEPDKQVNTADPRFPEWEGINQAAVSREAAIFPMKVYSENGNFFVLVQQLLHRKINKTVLSVMSLISILLVVWLFWQRHRASGFLLTDMAIAGFCLYMIADLFSPVYRHQYYATLWLFPLMISAVSYNASLQKIYCLIAAGLVLNILNIPFLPMEHTMGEYMMLLGFILLSLRRKTHRIE